MLDEPIKCFLDFLKVALLVVQITLMHSLLKQHTDFSDIITVFVSGHNPAKKIANKYRIRVN